jgi:hypothetical protein
MAGVKCPRCGLFNPDTAERCDCGHQFVVRSVVGASSTSRTIQTPVAVLTQAPNTFAEVTVTDIKMPFASMVVFMVKWAIASIPALLILALLGFMLSAAVGGTLLTLSHGPK